MRSSSIGFYITIGNQVFPGRGAREQGGKALNDLVMSGQNDVTPKRRGGVPVLPRIYSERRMQSTAPGQTVGQAATNQQRALDGQVAVGATLG